jgi:pimeloyl-ACP methyl ester carboxylesterase
VKSRVPESHLGLDADEAHDVEAGCRRCRGVEQAGLADARFSPHHEDTTEPVACTLEEAPDLGLLGLAAHDCIEQFSETDFNDELTRIDVPTLLIHGDDDQIVPIEASAQLAVQLIKGAELKVYPGGSHGLFATQVEQLNRNLLEFSKA